MFDGAIFGYLKVFLKIQTLHTCYIIQSLVVWYFGQLLLSGVQNGHSHEGLFEIPRHNVGYMSLLIPL